MSEAEDTLDELRGLLSGEPDKVANAANLSALLFARVPRLNWLGIYFLRGDTLVLGPFQGQPACTRIGMGQGVCGTAAAENRTVVVADVHAFAGHIACDSASMSEIVVPLRVGGRVMGVLDVDSPELDRFGAAERAFFEAAAAIYAESLADAGEAVLAS